MAANKVTRRLYLILAIVIIAYIAYNYFIIRKKEGARSKNKKGGNKNIAQCKKCKNQCKKCNNCIKKKCK